MLCNGNKCVHAVLQVLHKHWCYCGGCDGHFDKNNLQVDISICITRFHVVLCGNATKRFFNTASESVLSQIRALTQAICVFGDI